MPVFVLLIFGIFEFSGFTMTKTGAGAAVKAGTRMAVVAGNSTMADRDILRRIQKEATGLSQDHITKVVIWNAKTPGENVPTNCLSVGVFQGGNPFGASDYGSCNVYLNPQADAFQKANLPLMTPSDTYGPSFSDYYFGCSGPSDPGAAHKLDCDWPSIDRRALEPSEVLSCPTPRPTRPQVAAGADQRCLEPDLVGIYIEVEHDHYTGFFGNQTIIKDRSTAKIEPQGYDK